MAWTTGRDTRCTFVNQKWLDFTGGPFETQLGDGWTRNIHPDDAEKRKIKKGDDLIVKSEWGEIRVKAKPSIMVMRGTVAMMHGWAKANVNELVPRQFDPITGYAPYKEVPVEVLKG